MRFVLVFKLKVVAVCLYASLVPLKTANAQAVIAPTCPPGYHLSGNNCVQGAPKPSCPAGYTLSGGQCIASAAAPTRPGPPAPSSTATQEFGHLDCDQLWHARNKIFAEHGYCFKTARAKRAFPNNCFPPYGKNLPAWANNDIRRIKEVENAKRCSATAAPARSRPAAPPAEGSTAFELYDCQGLWRHRNGIYASKGYCFKTARAKREFPNNCFPPYGKLSASEQREVNETKKWEKFKGCR